MLVNPGDPNYLIASDPGGVTSPGTLHAADATPWLTPGILDAVAPGVPAGANSNVYQGWVADNIIGLWVRCLDANGYPITMTAAAGGNPGLTNSNRADAITTNYSFDSRLGYSTFDPSVSSYASPSANAFFSKVAFTDTTGAGNGQTILNSLPAVVEVAIVVVDAKTAGLITAVPSYTPQAMATPPTGVASASAPYTGYSPFNFWNDINYFVGNLPLRVRAGAHIYSRRVVLLNGGN